MKTEELTTEQRLEIITNMIGQAKRNFAKGGSFQILLWGWVIAAANLGHYALEKIGYEYPYAVWLIVIPAVVVSIVQSVNMRKNSPVKSHVDKVYGQIWLAAFIVFIIVLSFMNQLNFHHNPVILAIAGMGMYITGNLLRFRPVIFGAVVLWVGAVLAFNLPVAEQYLVGGISILIGYLVPGYLLQKEEN
jgi:hypothetical protein